MIEETREYTKNIYTRIAYHKTAVRLMDQIEASQSIGGVFRVIRWLNEKCSNGNFRPATVRQYKSAMAFFIEDNFAEEGQAALIALKNISYSSNPNRTKLELRTSAKKMKHISAEDEYQFLQKWLPKSHCQWAPLLRLWMIATLNTGSRPCEWQSARCITQDDQSMAVVLKNAKNSNGRSHGETRTIPIGHLPPDVQKEIEALTVEVAERINAGMTFNQLKKAIENAAYQESRRCWPKRKSRHVCLYTMRHQFSANMKASGLSRREVGALMGHATDKTATIHYAKKRSGRLVDNVRVVASEVDRVKEKFKGHPENSRTPKLLSQPRF